MRLGAHQRLLVVAVLVALALGVLFGWYVRVWLEPTPESRVRDTADSIRDRIREFTH